MSSSTGGRPWVVLASAGLIVVIVLLAGAFGAVSLRSNAAASPSIALVPASASSEQWAFGGSESSVYSCSNATCFGGVSQPHLSYYSLSLKFYIAWVVIYTQTNVSASQTQVEGQTALNLSASYTFAQCANVTVGQPCQSESLSLSATGHEAATGYTNITSGTVDRTAGAGGPGPVTALAVTNASSQENFNLSGSYSIASSNLSVPTGNANVDFGGSESSSIAFASPFGVVPVDPAAGENWTSEAAYTATGKYINGYAISGTENHTTVSESTWTPGSITPSGDLILNGSDLGPVTLYDNYTTPPTTVTAQSIELDFISGNYSAADGWVFTPTQLYGSLLSSFDLVAPAGHAAPAMVTHPAATGNLSLSSSTESAYYEEGPGFIGAGLFGNSTIPEGGVGSITVHLTAGPEPLSVARSQYSAIVNPSSGSSGFPLLLLWVVAVVAIVVVAGVLVGRRSVHRRPPSTAAVPPNVGTPPQTPGPGAP